MVKIVDRLLYIIDKYEIDIKQPSPIIIPGATREDLAKLFCELGYKTGAEIGVERGIYSEILSLANPNLKLFCIDAWEIYDGLVDYDKQHRLDNYYIEATNRLARYNCELIKKYSQDAVRNFSSDSLDFVYLDANHDFDFIMLDIINWSSVVRPGGIVSGHDYLARSVYHKFKYNVIEATNAYTAAHQINPWFILGGERSASWFWIKQ